METQTYKEYLDEGIFCFQNAEYNKAIELINQSIQLKNDFEISYFYRAACHHALNKLDEAMLDYTKSIKLNPKMTDAYYNRAKIILEKNNSSEKEILKAVDDLNCALSLDEKFIDALFALAAAKKKLKDYHGALESLEKLLTIEPNALHAKALKKLILQKYII